MVTLWVGCCGYYTGAFLRPWLDIPATGRQVAMRFHDEFFRVEDGRVVELQAVWDIPEVLMQAGVWPMGPSLGREGQVPGPATEDGLRPLEGDAETSLAIVATMLADMVKHPREPLEAMRLEEHWHSAFS